MAPNRGSFGVTIRAVLASAAIAHILTTREYPDISRGRCPERPLPASARAGERRHGDRVSGRGHQAPPKGRGEGAALRAGGNDGAGTLPLGDRGRGPAAAPPHPPAPRLGPSRRIPVLR